MTHPKLLTPAELREIGDGLACLIPNEGREVPSCHEYSLCDCTVEKLFAHLAALEKRERRLVAAVGVFKRRKEENVPLSRANWKELFDSLALWEGNHD